MKILPQNGFITADYAWLPQNTANYDFEKRITTDCLFALMITTDYCGITTALLQITTELLQDYYRFLQDYYIHLLHFFQLLLITTELLFDFFQLLHITTKLLDNYYTIFFKIIIYCFDYCQLLRNYYTITTSLL